VIRKYEFPVPHLKGKNLLFVSDIHLRGSLVNSILPGKKKLAWSGVEWVGNAFREALATVTPDYFVFGGDLSSESVWIGDGFSFFEQVPKSAVKIAVPGNWDKRRMRWLPHFVIENAYRKAGFHFLKNEFLELPGIVFYGMDDMKSGYPRLQRPFAKDGNFHCLAAHNPDSIPFACSNESLSDVDLILCGHTHAGQIRLPLLGAFYTSSIHWKRFEYGFYRSNISNTNMLISSGLGATFIPMRFLCPPEMLWIQFV